MSYLQSLNGSFEHRTASARCPRLESRVVQSGLPIDENSSSAAVALHDNPTTNFILPNDELQTCIPAASFPRFADIRGNGHFHACGDAIRGVDRGDHVQQCRIKDRYGKKPTGIKIL